MHMPVEVLTLTYFVVTKMGPKKAKMQELPGGFAPLVPLPGLCPGPAGDLGGPQTPRQGLRPP